MRRPKIENRSNPKPCCKNNKEEMCSLRDLIKMLEEAQAKRKHSHCCNPMHDDDDDDFINPRANVDINTNLDNDSKSCSTADADATADADSTADADATSDSTSDSDSTADA
ncbi:MAG: hypothetical protein ACLTT7_09945, partial [Paraclostridium bifermentans]